MRDLMPWSKWKKKTDENAMEKNRIEMISTENFMINKYFSSQKFIWSGF
jgi:hypothetical protein